MQTMNGAEECDDGVENSSFDDYIPITNDPGHWMIIGVSLYSLCCTCTLPFLVICGNRREKRRLDRKEWGRLEHEAQDQGQEDAESEALEDSARIGPIGGEYIEDSDEGRSTKINTVPATFLSKETLMNNNNDGRSALGSHVGSVSSISNRSCASKRLHKSKPRLNYANLYIGANESEEVFDLTHGQRYKDIHQGNRLQAKSVDGMSATRDIDDILPEDAADADDPGILPSFSQEEEEEQELSLCCGENSIFAVRNIRHFYGLLADIANIDNETKRILQLGWPMTLSASIGSISSVISVAIVSNYLGNDALVAYVITDLLIGLTHTFLAGPADALNTVCAHAVGAENFKLAGQYVQISAVLYLFTGVPLLAMWYFWIGDVARLMGVEENIVSITTEYTRIRVWYFFLSGLFEGYNSLLDVTGYAVVGSIFDIIYGLVNVAMLWSICANWEGVTLYWLGFVELMVAIFFFVVFTLLVIIKGWLNRFVGGMLGTFALSNMSAVKNVLQTSIPLSFGSLLEYGEWELLTFFVAYLGEAEIAAWGLLESLWGFFESATEGLSEAASIRVAYHLGKGHIPKAKMSCYKSLFMGVMLSFFITSFLFILGKDLATWFTPDALLQEMLNDLIPMIGIANIFMIYGMVAWTLVGAQGRYRLATIVSACLSFFVTLPLAALSTFYFVFDLKGIVGAVICGYSTTGLCLAYILLRSDWKHISETIQEYNSAEDDSSSDESSDSSSSSEEEDDLNMSYSSAQEY